MPGGLWFASESTRTGVDNEDPANPNFDGDWIAGSRVVTGELPKYDRKSGTLGGVPLSRSVYRGGKGASDLTARWSSIVLGHGLLECGGMEIASPGISRWLTPIFSVGMNYRYISNGRAAVGGTSGDLNTRVRLLLG